MKRGVDCSTAHEQHSMFAEFCEAHSVVDSVGDVLEQILHMTPASHDTLPEEIFTAKKAPRISVKQYLARFAKFTGFSDGVFVGALIYIDRVLLNFPKMRLSAANIHRLLLSSVVISAKQLEDQLQTQEHLARVAGVSTDELMSLELALLNMLNWRSRIDQNTFLIYVQKLNSFRPHAEPLTTAALKQLPEKQPTKAPKLSDISTLETESQPDDPELSELISKASAVFFS